MNILKEMMYKHIILYLFSQFELIMYIVIYKNFNKLSLKYFLKFQFLTLSYFLLIEFS